MLRRKGLISGLVISALGFGGFIFGIVTNRLINPDDVKSFSVEVAVMSYEYLFPGSVASRVP